MIENAFITVPPLPPTDSTPPRASDASEHSEHAVTSPSFFDTPEQPPSFFDTPERAEQMINPTHDDNESEDEVAATADEVTVSEF